MILTYSLCDICKEMIKHNDTYFMVSTRIKGVQKIQGQVLTVCKKCYKVGDSQ